MRVRYRRKAKYDGVQNLPKSMKALADETIATAVPDTSRKSDRPWEVMPFGKNKEVRIEDLETS